MHTTDDLPQELRRRPWLRVRSRPLRQTVVIDRQPNVQISVFDDAIYLTRRRGHGWITYPVDPDDLAGALGKLPTHSGLLPPNTLGTGTVNGQRFYVLLVPPRPARLRVTGRKEPFPLQTPPLIWAGCGQDYRIFALPSLDSPQLQSPLAHAPFPNTYDPGSICWGSTERRPDAGTDTMLPVLDLYLEGSFFNSHFGQHRSQSKPRSVVTLYRSLCQDRPYPLDDLVPAGRELSWLLSGDAWREGGSR